MRPRLRFDVTRLFAARRDGKALRGIDRTERHLVRWAAATPALDVEWVRQRRGQLVGLTAAQIDAFLAYAHADWGGSEQDASLPKRWLTALAFAPLTTGPAVVFNAGHKGLEDCAETTPKDDTFVAFVHDLIPLTHPDTVADAVVREARARMNAVAPQAAAVVVNSQATAWDFTAHCGAHHLPVPPVTIAPLGPALPVKRSARANPPTFVFLSSIEPRKNLSLLLDVWQTLTDEADPPQLAVIGRRHGDRDVAARLDAGVPNVTELGVLSDLGAADVLASATALLTPSVTEGYGMPIVEAHAMGVPVIASDVPAHREVGGAGAQYLPPNDPAAWRAAILELAQNQEALAAQVAAIPPAPTWTDHAAIVERVLMEAAPQPAYRAQPRAARQT